MHSDEKLLRWLDSCDEWVTTNEHGPDMIPFLQARLGRAVKELRKRIETDREEEK